MDHVQIAQYERWLAGEISADDEGVPAHVADGLDDLRRMETEQNMLLMLAGGGFDDDDEVIE